MRSLVLVRHAKSDWADAALRDHDRPLNSRGERDAPVMADRLAASGFTPDTLLSSTALRARTTAGVFGAAWDMEPALDERLYGASPAEILRVVAEHETAHAVIVVAHDPGLSMLASSFAPDIAGMPTCAVARFEWQDDVSWHAIEAVAPAEWSFDTPR